MKMRHAERIGDEAGVLAARAAETVERIIARVEALGDRNAFDGVGHVLDRDADEAVGDVFRAATGRLARELGEFRAHASRRPAARRHRRRKCAGRMRAHSFPTITLASVTVSGPPRR